MIKTMIVYPKNWNKLQFELKEEDIEFDPVAFIELLTKILKKFDVKNLAFSGGIDSTIILALMSELFDEVNTFVVTCRSNHPDALFARIGSEKYSSRHHEIIYSPPWTDSTGDDAVKTLFQNFDGEKIITCDGIDELAGGYYQHLSSPQEDNYIYYLNRLIPDHLIPLDKNSGDTKVFLPFLDSRIINTLLRLPLSRKMDHQTRKIPIRTTAQRLKIPEEIIERNKYGFCDAGLKENK